MKRFLIAFALSSQLLAFSSLAQTFPTPQSTGVTVNADFTLRVPTASAFFTANAGALGSVLSGTYQPLDADLTAIASLSTQPFGRSLLTGATAGAVNTLLGLSGLFQPLENQRLSTGYSPTFAGLTLNGALTGAFGDTITNLYAGGIQIYADSTGFGSTQAYRIGDFGYGGSYHSLTDGIDNWDTGGGGLVIASGAAQIDTVGHFSGNGFSDLTGNGFQGSSFDVFTNPISGRWDFGFADVRGRNLILYDGGGGPDGQINYHASLSTFEFGGSDLGVIGNVYFAYGLIGGSYDIIANPSSGLWDFADAGASFAGGVVTINSDGGVRMDGELKVTYISSIDGEVDFAVPIRAQHRLTSGVAAFDLGGVLYYPHASAGVLSFTTTQ